MYPKHLITDFSAIIPLNNNGSLVAEAYNPGTRGDEPGASRSVEAEMLIQIMVVQADNGWL